MLGGVEPPDVAARRGFPTACLLPPSPARGERPAAPRRRPRDRSLGSADTRGPRRRDDSRCAGGRRRRRAPRDSKPERLKSSVEGASAAGRATLFARAAATRGAAACESGGSAWRRGRHSVGRSYRRRHERAASTSGSRFRTSSGSSSRAAASSSTTRRASSRSAGGGFPLGRRGGAHSPASMIRTSGMALLFSRLVQAATAWPSAAVAPLRRGRPQDWARTSSRRSPRCPQKASARPERTARSRKPDEEVSELAHARNPPPPPLPTPPPPPPPPPPPSLLPPPPQWKRRTIAGGDHKVEILKPAGHVRAAPQWRSSSSLARLPMGLSGSRVPQSLWRA